MLQSSDWHGGQRQVLPAALSDQLPAQLPDQLPAQLPDTLTSTPPDMQLRQMLRGAVAVVSLGVLPALGVLAQVRAGSPIGVIFPDIGEPFRQVFSDIIAGIEQGARMRVQGFPVSASQDPDELAATLKRSSVRVAVALGRQGIKAASALDPATGLVVSGVSSVPDGEHQVGICLTPDPALLFAHLKLLAPAIKRVVTVFNPANNEWLLKLAREAARGAELDLAAFEARDLATAARQFEIGFAGADGKRDAVWLPIDPTTVDENTILPIVLREAWKRNVALFSSSVLHVKRGALFALYPNNIELGRNIAHLATAWLAGDVPTRGVTPLRDVHAALNLRTASHIGLTVPIRTQRVFHSQYPVP